MGEITISVEEYKELLKAWVRVSAFADFVNASKYDIEKEDCGRYFGFKVEGEGNG